MGFEGEVWRLIRQEELLGEIVIDEADCPWLSGRLVPTPTLGEAKSRFDDSYDRIADTVLLVALSGSLVEGVLGRLLAAWAAGLAGPGARPLGRVRGRMGGEWGGSPQFPGDLLFRGGERPVRQHSCREQVGEFS